VGEMLDPHPHIAGADAPMGQIWDPHPPDLKSADAIVIPLPAPRCLVMPNAEIEVMHNRTDVISYDHCLQI